jgi:excisionase family DNA binding protein
MDGNTHSAITLSVRQAAAYVGASTKTIYRAIKDGRLKAAAFGCSDAIRMGALRKPGGVR